MNDTIVSPRQKHILNIIQSSNGLLREQIQTEVDKVYQISKPTIIRDLNSLLDKKLIKSQGSARATKYYPLTQNPLLRKFDINRYFLDEPDQRIKAQKSFDYGMLDSLYDLFTSNELQTLTSIAKSFKAETQKLNSDILKRELERFVIELSWKSSKIEGNTYSLLETESLIKDQKQAPGKTKKETIMILNHKNTFDQILNNIHDFKNLKISTINQLHNTLIKDLDISTGIRNQAVGITGTVYQPLDNQHQVSEVFSKTIDIINEKISPFDKALIASFMIPYIQPYSDGNKRTTRMLTNAILLGYDLYPLSYRSVDEDNFKKALILFYEQGSIIEIKKIFIEQVVFSNQTYFK